MFGGEKKVQLWTKCKNKDPSKPQPLPRSGHTMTLYKTSYWMFGGTVNGLLDPQIKRVLPSNELWLLEMFKNGSYVWSKQQPKGEIPCPRSNHVSGYYKKSDGTDYLLIHGGMTQTGKLDDLYLFDLNQNKFSKVEFTNAPDENIPSPRASHSSYIFEGKFYIFGGNGGHMYENQVFKDLWVLDLETMRWTELMAEEKEEKTTNLPECRTGHTMFIYQDEVYIYGGFNQNTCFNTMIKFSLSKLEWTNFGVSGNEDKYRWNHCGVDVESLPAWKYFVFGGSTGFADDTKPRERGNVLNDVLFMDLGTEVVESVKLDNLKEVPFAREDASMFYNKSMKSLVVYGGWSNEWYNEIYSINVTKIVGPTYTVKTLEPNEGRISGGQEVKIIGSKLPNNMITVYFYYLKDKEKGEYKIKTQTANFISDTEAILTTPSFHDLGPREVEVRIGVEGEELSTNPAIFNIYLDTKAETSIFYGPGCCDGSAFGCPNFFVIRARNELNENRISGRDEFLVTVVEEQTMEIIPHVIEDNKNGTYKVIYTPPNSGKYKITVQTLEENIKKSIRGSPISVLYDSEDHNANKMNSNIMYKFLRENLENLEKKMSQYSEESTIKDIKDKEKNQINIETLINIKNTNREIELCRDKFDTRINELEEFFKQNESEVKKHVKEATHDKIKHLFNNHHKMIQIKEQSSSFIAPLILDQTEKKKEELKLLEKRLKEVGTEIRNKPYAKDYHIGYEKAFQQINETEDILIENQVKLDYFDKIFKDLNCPDETVGCIKIMENTKADIIVIKKMWKFIEDTLSLFESFKNTKWPDIDGPGMDEKIGQSLTKKLTAIRKEASLYSSVVDLISREINQWKKIVPLIAALKADYVLERHWDMVREILNCPELKINDDLYLRYFYDKKIQEKNEEIGEVTERAATEDKMSKKLAEIESNWISFTFNEKPYSRVEGLKLLEIVEDNFAILEDNMQHIQTLSRNRFKKHFEERIDNWKRDLNTINDANTLLSEVQGTWSFLERLFIGSDEIKKELPEDTERFQQINVEVIQILRKGAEIQNIHKFSIHVFDNKLSVVKWLEDIIKRLGDCERSLNYFMETKRTVFPRFYFISSVDLLDILSNGNNPATINKHINKVILAIEKLELSDSKGDRPSAKGMHTRVGKEYVPFEAECKLLGKVESYLDLVLRFMKDGLKKTVKDSLVDFKSMEQFAWIDKTPSQTCLLTDLIIFCSHTEEALNVVEKDPKSLQRHMDNQVKSLTQLIKTVMNQMSDEAMAKVMVLIKSETHSRDVIDKLINEKVISIDEFQWQSQLKAYWDTERNDCHLNVADAEFWYGYEYLGNGDRLVVTPLTDRIYVTATQALHLKMGCAPAGPAGTGKTETTKDLASALGKACYVFNCSDQMDYKGMGEIFRGLASSGSWGCFDEFNRLIPEVLSVCSMQFKSVVDALKRGDKVFTMQESKVTLDPTCGAFITMNPGYLGRSELPEGLKALFRPITVMVPDFEMISENCLMAQGFESAKILAKKFVVLYSLCQDLLSKQMHYDWGLRAIKSVLVVAGAFKRTDKQFTELQLLKRALRDFNTPKIVKDDIPIFMGLIEDLFPQVDVERKVNVEFEKLVVDACAIVNKKVGKANADVDQVVFKLYPDPEFVLKVVQLKELLEIRHSVFVMGNAGSGKSSCWKTLAKTFDLFADVVGNKELKTETRDVNPKSILSDDLYGKYINIQTRDFKYGILSTMMKNMSTAPDKHQKWIILDGDLDANWIENMNSVMDDNKVLTLPNNDRIDLLPNMRLIFEIRDLKFATKATVSRAGILFISDDTGYQWKAYVISWIESMNFKPKIKEEINTHFFNYLEKTLQLLKRYRFIVQSVFQITFVVSCCKLLEAYLEKKYACNSKKVNIDDEKGEDGYVGLDHVFAYCVLWSCGAILTEKELVDYRRNFSEDFKNMFKEIKFPNKGTIFDYYMSIDFDNKTFKFEEWNKKIPEIEYKANENIKYVTVPTSETVSVGEIMDKLLDVGQPALLIGNAGCGKTQLCKGMLETKKKVTEQQGSSFSYVTVNFNYYTDTYMIQTVLIQNTDKFSNKTFMPKGNPKLMSIYIDDLNMQKLDSCNTQNAIELLRQFMDYKHIYECSKMELMEFININFTAAMNPTAGSFDINPRLQRHFWICAIPFPSDNSLTTIYSFFQNGHFKNFNQAVYETVSSRALTIALLQLHQRVSARFKKSAANFHYEFNIRHLTGVLQGLLMSTTEKFKDPEKLVKLWIHETERIYGDRLVSPSDLNTYKKECNDIVKKNFPKWNLSRYFDEKKGEALIFCRFTAGIYDNTYDMANKIGDVKIKAIAALEEYNESNAVMDLTLFDDAVKHICRITRIISQPSGHALLVGVGGSGKQSLSKLSSFICQYSTYMITISQEYKLTQFKEDLQKMYNATGKAEDSGYLFIFTEGQIVDEKFMVPVNDLLSSGEVQDLFNNDDKEALFNLLKQPCKNQTGKDTPQDVWNFFIDRVKKNLHMAICFSPGDNLRQKARKFPAIVNTTVIDWFQPWPEEALTSVGREKLRDLQDTLDNEELYESVIKFMPYSFSIVGNMADRMHEADRRYTYVTPKSFLELLELFKEMYKTKIDNIYGQKIKLVSGLEKLVAAKEKISSLEAVLAVKSVEITKIKIVAEEKEKEARTQAEIVSKEAAKAEAEEKIVSEMKIKIEEESSQCQAELDELKPMMEEACELAKQIKKKDLDDVRAIKPSPSQLILDVIASVLLMLAGQVDEIPIEVDKNRFPKKYDKSAFLGLLMNTQALQQCLTDTFIEKIKTFQVHAKNFENLVNKFPDFFKKDRYEENCTKTKNAAFAIGVLYQWLYNMYNFYVSAREVEPKQKKVDQKKEELAEAVEKVTLIKIQVAELNQQLEEVMENKRKAELELKTAEADEFECKDKLELARRFINALGSSNERWEQNIKDYDEQLSIIIGDILVASAFVSYCGPFPKKYRETIKTSFGNFINENKIPISSTGLDPLNILTDDAQKAVWNNQKLPADPVSIENGAILTNSKRWSLMIDPQLQGIKWIREKESSNGLTILRMNAKKLISECQRCIQDGCTVLLENIDENIDATLSPIIGRYAKKKGMNKVYVLGGEDCIIHQNFKFILHTKLSNPHYPPEIQAETTLINFTVTEDGLEDQLLSLIVKMERPKLAATKEEVIDKQNKCKIQLRELEEGILKDLGSDGDLLENRALITRLENSKVLSEEANKTIKEAKIAEVEINVSSDFYRPAAARGSLVFFLMTELYKLHSFYCFSLESFIFVIQRSIKDIATKWRARLKAENEDENKNPEEEGNEGGENNEDKDKEKEEKKEEEVEEEPEEEMADNVRKQRVEELVNSITDFSFNYVRRGLFERHKLIFSTLLAFRILIKSNKLVPEEVAYLIEGKKEKDILDIMNSVPKDYLKENQVASVKALENLPGFEDLLATLCSTSEINFWRRWLKEEKAESNEMPKSMSSLSTFQKLLLIRALRPDRITNALTNFIVDSMGQKFIDGVPFDMADTYVETSKLTPVFFVLFPGVDPTIWVENQVKKLGKNVEDFLINIPMGQGQEKRANSSLESCAKTGKWIMLQNVHLMTTWLKRFENDLEAFSFNAHQDFRCFISSEPPPLPTMQTIPEPILQNAVKVANEAPQDLKANLVRAWRCFDQKRIDSSAKPNEFKSILFGLCYFHALVIGRKKFGPIGWSRVYNFNEGDLTICADVLTNYLNKYSKVPYEDLRYIYGEIMYGGHITDYWDRRTNAAYLVKLIKPELLMSCTLAPNFKALDPTKSKYESYTQHIEHKLPVESPVLFYLHSNAEISYLTSQGETLFDSVFSVQGGSIGGGATGGKKDDETELIKKYVNQLKEYPMFDLNEIKKKKDFLQPYDIVAVQECERLNSIFSACLKSLDELEKGLNGELNITDNMEALSHCLKFNRLPEAWDAVAGYPSKKSLSFWFLDLLRRHEQMREWSFELKLPKCVNVNLLCNPMSFITAVKQVTARSKTLALDNLDIMTNITTFTEPDLIKDYPTSGVYIYGMFLQGAKWEEGVEGSSEGYLTEMAAKELDPKIPVMLVFSVPLSEKNTVGFYSCPVYYTTGRGPTYIFTAYLKMENEDVAEVTWILAGVALILSTDE